MDRVGRYVGEERLLWRTEKLKLVDGTEWQPSVKTRVVSVDNNLTLTPTCKCKLHGNTSDWSAESTRRRVCNTIIY